MRSHVAIASLVSVLGVLAACSSSSSPAVQQEASAGCTDTLVNVFNDNTGVACPVDANGNPETYDQAITATCASEKLKTGDVEYGPCFDYLVFELDKDSTGNNFTKCFYDTTHALVGVLYGDGTQDQCGGSSYTVAGGSVDLTCTVGGLNGGGGGFQSCTPVVDAGSGESSLLGQ